MTDSNKEFISQLFKRIADLEKDVALGDLRTDNELVQKQKQIEELKDIIAELREFTETFKGDSQSDLVDVDERLTTMEEMLNSAHSQLEQLEDRTDVLEDSSGESNEAIKEVVKKVIIAIIGGLVTYLFSKF